MRKSVSNILTSWKLKSLSDAGIDANALLGKCNISSHELNSQDGRILDCQHYRLMLETVKYNDLLMKAITVNNFYLSFPDFFGLCLNEFSASEAVDSFVKYRFVMGDCDYCEIKRESGRIMVLYRNTGPEQFASASAIGNFVLICDLLRRYLPRISIQAGFVGKGVGIERSVNNRLKTNCSFYQNDNYLVIMDSSLDKKSDFFNEDLSLLQRSKLDGMRGEFSNAKTFSNLVAEIVASIISKGDLEGHDSIIGNLCSSLSMSRWTLNGKLKLEGTSFSEVLKKERIAKTSKFLIETDKSIREISELACFSSQAAFSNFFRLHKNISPVQYRRKHKMEMCQ